ncbi:MAG TPA: hypothetical protein DHW36_12785 [Thalassospira sp.]|nr:hypothetical protein [Thalassospira sp.]
MTRPFGKRGGIDIKDIRQLVKPVHFLDGLQSLDPMFWREAQMSCSQLWPKLSRNGLDSG